MRRLPKCIKKVINRYPWCLDFNTIARNYNLSERIIRKIILEGYVGDHEDFSYAISIHQVLSEEFIREFKDKVNWYCISAYQKLSEGFIREFKYKVNFDELRKSEKISDEIKAKLGIIKKE